MKSPTTTTTRVYLVTLLLSAMAAIPARADIFFQMDQVSANVGRVNNSFEVLIENTGSTAVDIAGMSFEISTPNNGITFTQSTTGTTTPYLFAGNSLTDALFGGISSVSAPGQTLDASDNVLTPNSSIALAPNATLGLGLVFFDVSPSASTGAAAVEFTGFPYSSLSDANGNCINIDTFSSGTITINQPEVVLPETGTIVPLGILFLVIGIGHWRRCVNRKTA